MVYENQDPRENYILAKLPWFDCEVISEWLEPINFEIGESLAQAGQPMEDFMFITKGIVSLSSTTSLGESVEVAIVGREVLLVFV